MINEKKCPKCNKIKPFTEYYKNRSGKFGLGHYCKECANRINKICMKKKIRTPEVKERQRVASKEWREKNKEKNTEYNREIQQKFRKDPIKYARQKSRSVFNFILVKYLREGFIGEILDEKMKHYTGKKVEELVEYLEKGFKKHYGEEINWENRYEKSTPFEEKLELDHILPMREFDVRNKKEFTAVWDYANLRILKAPDNRNR